MLEDDLRTLFTLEAEADQPPSQISVPVAGRNARVRQRRQRALMIGSPVLAAAAVIAVIATSVALAGGGERIPRPTSPTGPAMPLAVPGSASWTRLPRAPIGPRSEYAAVWTGKKMIVWGGYSGNTTQYADGAVYEPATRTWTKIAAAPLSARILPVAVWTGKDMLIFGGAGNSNYSDGAAYDPATNTWRTLAPIPRFLGGNLTGTGSYAVWTGKVMVAWGFFGHGRGGHGGGSLAAGL